MNLTQIRDHIDLFYGPPLSVLSDCIRGFLIAKPGHDLIACDFSAIEARVLAWLAGEHDVLEIFDGHGKIYEHAAAGIYMKPIEEVTKDERQVGKVAILALGYGGGVGAFQTMAKGYGVKVDDFTADQIKIAWRHANREIVNYWYDLERAGFAAINNPGTKHLAGYHRREVAYLVKGSFLWCRLPSNRVLCYPYPRIEPVMTPWDEMKDAITFMGVNSLTNKWERQKTYGGSLSENVTQAVARDLLADSLLRISQLPEYSVVMHVHDEIVVEVAEGRGSLAEIKKIMSTPPAWAAGLPMAAEGWRGKRYRK